MVDGSFHNEGDGLSLEECGEQGSSLLCVSPIFFSRSACYRARYLSGVMIRACSKMHYRSESNVSLAP